MVQLFSDGSFALKSIEKDWIGFHVGMWNL
jgi:hypothetical protein